MFSLVLAILISTVDRFEAAPGLGTFGAGFTGGLNQIGEGYSTPTKSYGSHFLDYRPQHPYLGHYGSPESVYLPGRINPYSYPFYRSTIPAPSKEISESNDKKTRSPQMVVYETIPSAKSVPGLVRSYPLPYYEIIEIFTLHNGTDIKGLEQQLKNKKDSDKSTEELNNLANKKTAEILSKAVDGSQTKPMLRMSYAGFVPQEYFKPINPSFRHLSVRPPNGIPFYPVNIGGPGHDNRDSLPPVLYSSYRIQPDIPEGGLPGTYRPIDSESTSALPVPPESSSTQETGSTGLGNRSAEKSHINQFSEVTPPAFPYGSTILGDPRESNYIPEETPAQHVNGYYFVDV